MFYNTIKLSGADLQLARDNSKSQEDFIKFIFKNQPDLEITPSQMLELFGKNIPLTSVRRALTNLTNENFLEKTEIMTEGLYGKPEHIWRLKTKNKNNKWW